MNRRLVSSEKKEAGKHIFRQNWWPILIVFILMLYITLPVKLAVAADPLSLVGKWTGSQQYTVTTRRMVDQKMDAPVGLEITDVSQDGLTFRGTLRLYSAGLSSASKVIHLDGRIENGMLKADLGGGIRLELSIHGNALDGLIIHSEYDTDKVNLKKIVDSPAK